MDRKGFQRFLVLLTLLASANLLAETTSYTGTGTYDGTVLQMTLANEQTVTGIRADVIATISTNPPALLFGQCMGMGLIPAEGEEAGYGADFYCTFRQSEEDAFDFKGVDQLGGITIEVIGGSGKWAGASGSGTIDRTRHRIGSGDFAYEVTITTP